MLCAGQSQDCPDPCFAHEQSQDCAANPWFVPQTMDPGFAQDNPGIAQIHALRVTDSCVSAKVDASPIHCADRPRLMQSIVDDVVPVFDEIARHSLYELELLLEEAKRNTFVAHMIGSAKPLKKVKQLIKKIKGKLKKQPHLKTKKIEVDLTEFLDNWVPTPSIGEGPPGPRERPERPELGKIRKHILDILSPIYPGGRPSTKAGKTVSWSPTDEVRHFQPEE